MADDKTDPVSALRQSYFDAMSDAPATVNVVTTNGPGGRAGVTVSAMSSVSADGNNPVLLVCINEKGSAAERILKNGQFCVNILREHQSYISDVFAGRYNDTIPDKFEATDWTETETKSPAIVDALAALDCTVMQTEKVGSHYVIFGEVQKIVASGEGSALTYARRGYNRVQPIDFGLSHPEHEDAAKPPLTLGCFHTFAPHLIPPIIRQLNDAGDDIRFNLIEGDGARIELGLLNGEIDLAFIYGADVARGLRAHPVVELRPQVLLPAGHRLGEKTAIAPQDLAGEPMISAMDRQASERVERELRAHGVSPKVAYRSSSMEMARSMVAEGLGFAIVMASIAVRGAGDRIVAKPLEVDAEPGRIVLVHAEDRPIGSLEKRLLELARKAWD